MNFECLFDQLNPIMKAGKNIVIYGFGTYGRNLYKICNSHGIKINSFVVSEVPVEYGEADIPLKNASDFFCSDNTVFLCALNEKNYKEVEHYLTINNVTPNRIINGGLFMDGYGAKRGMHHSSFEVVTIIGCPVNCKFCPQKVFLQNYYKRDKSREQIMSLETFDKILDYYPKSFDISFGGMSEPFLNPNFMDMLKKACSERDNVSLYTTLVGVKKEYVRDLLSLPFVNVVIHVADEKKYANIPQTDEYFEIFETLINAKKADGTPFVNMVNAQTTPVKRIKEICGDKYEIFTEMTDRAGNLNESGLIKNRVNKGEIQCWNYSKDVSNTLVLPDGSIILCCMDFGLKHILGNIYENNFEEVINGREACFVLEGMKKDSTSDILCRRCTYARIIN